MAIREIKYNVTPSGVTPASHMWGGVQNEDNATNIIYYLDLDFLEALGDSKNLRFRIDFNSASAGYEPSENLTLNESRIERTIPQRMTQYGGQMECTLVISRIIPDKLPEASEVILQIPSIIFFTASGKHSKRFDKNLSAYEEYVLSLVKKAEQLVESVENMKINVDDEIKNIKSDIDSCVKNDQFADNKGNGGIVRINEAYGISMGRYDLSSPGSGDSIIIHTASDGLIKQRTNKFMPITPSNIDYAVKCALTDSRISWKDADKQAVRELLGINQTIPNTPVFYNASFDSDGIVTGAQLEDGARYKATITFENEDNNIIDGAESVINYSSCPPNSFEFASLTYDCTISAFGKGELYIQQIEENKLQIKFLYWREEDGETVPYNYTASGKITLEKLNV